MDPDVATARGVPVRALALGVHGAAGTRVALSIQIVGALLVLSLLITPAAAAMRVTSSPGWCPAVSIVFAMSAIVGGILLALGGRLPISPYVTTMSFLIYLACRAWGALLNRSSKSARVTAAA